MPRDLDDAIETKRNYRLIFWLGCEEDMNLHYVVITRAKKACFLCSSTRRIGTDRESGELVNRQSNLSEFLATNGLSAFRRDL